MITIQNLTKTYHTKSGEVEALRGISAEIRDGDIFGIIGLSGAGKSTLLRCIALLETPTSGSISIDGRDLSSLRGRQLTEHRRQIGVIFQGYNLLMQRTVSGNIAFPLEIAGVPRAKADERVKELLEIVGLSHKANAYPVQLSGGQKQRIAIARALASDPDVLLSDEATSALDPMTTQSILALLQDINRRLGITIVIMTHGMAVMGKVCNRVTVFDGGKIGEEGTVDGVFTHTRGAAGRRLFGVIKEDNDQEIHEAVRVVFDGSTLNDPVLSDFIMKTGMPVNILSADVRRLNGKPYGQMLLALPESYADREKLIHGLREMGLTAEEVHS